MISVAATPTTGRLAVGRPIAATSLNVPAVTSRGEEVPSCATTATALAG